MGLAQRINSNLEPTPKWSPRGRHDLTEYAIAVLGKTQKFRAGFLLGFLCDRGGGPIVQNPDPRKIYFPIFDSPPNSRRGKIARVKKNQYTPPLEKFKTDISLKGSIVIWN